MMKRSTVRGKQAGKVRQVVYLLAATGMLFYGLSQFELRESGQAANWFWLVWLLFAAIIIAANVNALLFMNEEKQAAMARIKRAKAQQLERLVERTLQKRAASRGSRSGSR